MNEIKFKNNEIVQMRMRPNGFFLILQETSFKFLDSKGGFGQTCTYTKQTLRNMDS